MRALVAPVALVACVAACSASNSLPIAASKKTIADSADQVIFGMRTTITDRGLQRAFIEADTAFFFDENTRVEMLRVRGVFYSSNGAKDAVMVSRSGKYNSRMETLEAYGDVEVSSVDGRKLFTPFLRFDQRINQISSESTFTVKESDGKETKGIGFRSDPDLQNIQVFKHLSTKAGAVTLPEK